MKKLIVTLMISTMAFTGCSTVNENPNTAKGAGIGAADQQHLQCGRVNDHQHGLWDFVGALGDRHFFILMSRC